jgi:hypothetical protein
VWIFEVVVPPMISGTSNSARIISLATWAISSSGDVGEVPGKQDEADDTGVPTRGPFAV